MYDDDCVVTVLDAVIVRDVVLHHVLKVQLELSHVELGICARGAELEVLVAERRARRRLDVVVVLARRNTNWEVLGLD